MDSGSLLKAIMGPVEVKILLSLGGWLSHGQSCHNSYFYISKQKMSIQYFIDSLTDSNVHKQVRRLSPKTFATAVDLAQY